MVGADGAGVLFFSEPRTMILVSVLFVGRLLLCGVRLVMLRKLVFRERLTRANSEVKAYNHAVGTREDDDGRFNMGVKAVDGVKINII